MLLVFYFLIIILLDFILNLIIRDSDWMVKVANCKFVVYQNWFDSNLSHTKVFNSSNFRLKLIFILDYKLFFYLLFV